MEKKQKIKAIRQAIKSAAIGLICVFTLTSFTACGAKDSAEAGAVPKEDAVTTTGEALEAEKSVEEQLEEEIAQMRSRYMFMEEPFMSVSQPGNYIVNGVELCDAVEAPQEPDDTWEGYSEEELGFLKPDSMPNCLSGEQDCHFVIYDEVMYVYVNEYNAAFGERSTYTEYANVWCSTDGSRVLGGLEEYGRECARERGGAE